MTRGRDDVPLLPAYLDDERTVKCGLPAEVRCRFTMRSTDGPLESAMIRCPAGHRFNGTIESLTWDSANKHNPGTAAAPSVAGHGRLPRTRDGRDSQGGVALDEFPAGPGPAARRPNCAPAYYLGRHAHRWITGMGRSLTASSHPVQAVTGGGEGTPPLGGGHRPGTGAGTARMTPATAPWPRRGKIVMVATDRPHAVITGASSGIGARSPPAWPPAD
jgi:hypothetical protein